jgi:hypothetical protein
LSLFSIALGFFRDFPQASQGANDDRNDDLQPIAAIAVVAGLVTICRTAYVVAGRSTEAPKPVEAAAQRELKRAA